MSKDFSKKEMIMSTLAQSAAWFWDELEAVGRFFARAVNVVAKHKQLKAEAFVRPYLARLPAEELEEMGFGAAEISEIKALHSRTTPNYP